MATENINELKRSYRRHIRRLSKTSSYFKFHRSYTKILSRLTALFLQDLMNVTSLDYVEKEITEDEQEMFWCSASFLARNGLDWTKREQGYHFKILKKQGFVKTIRKGLPARRWVLIDYDAIREAIDTAEISKNSVDTKTSQLSCDKNLSTERNNNVAERIKHKDRKKKESRTATLRAASDTSDLFSSNDKQELSPAARLAKFLHDSLVKKNRLARRLKSLSAWAAPFNLLLQSNSYKELRNWIRFLTRHYDDQFCPKIRSAQSFHDKLPALKDHKRRLEQATLRDQGFSDEYLRGAAEDERLRQQGEV